jgi:hypothetical protein
MLHHVPSVSLVCYISMLHQSVHGGEFAGEAQCLTAAAGKEGELWQWGEMSTVITGTGKRERVRATGRESSP